MSGRIVILSGPSGVGKDTVIAEWANRDPRVQRVIAYTTRAPREGESNEVDYHFITREDFLIKAETGDFLEWKEVHGNLYATPLRDMETMLQEGKIAILKIDVQGGIEAMAKRPDALSIFLLPPSFDELERRIRDRATDDEQTIQKRLKNSREEIELASRYHHQVVNDDVDRAVSEIQGLVS